MHPVIALNWPAILVSVLASFAIGSLWYGPLFGRVWVRAMGFQDFRPERKAMFRGMALNVGGTLLTAFVLAHEVAVWRPSTWVAGATDMSSWTFGFFGAFFVWLGFVVPVLLNAVAYEGRNWKVFGLGAGYHFLSLQAMGMILAHWR